MKYMLLIYLDEQALSESERGRCYEQSAQLAHDRRHFDNFGAGAGEN